MSDTIHIISRHWWVANKDEGASDSIPYVSRCGIIKLRGFVYLDRKHRKWVNNFKTKEPTCEACILLHWLNPVGTEDYRDYDYNAKKTEISQEDVFCSESS